MIRLARTTAVAAAIAVAFGAGFATGADDGSDDDARLRLDAIADRIAADAAEPVDRSALDQAAVQGMLDVLDDRWATFYVAGDYTEFRERLDGYYTGVGLWVARGPAGRVSVTHVAPGSPAAAAGVRAGAELVTVAGRAVTGLPVSEVVAALRGDAGTPVTIVVRAGRARRTVVLRRDAVAAADVTVRTVRAGAANAPLTVVRIASFTTGAGRDVRRAVATARADGSLGVVLDLRGAPGGLLHEAVEVASTFLDGGTVVSYARRGHEPRRLLAVGDGDTRIPVAVLVDGGTASAAEVVAAALQDRRRAVLVGSRTFGKGSVQEAHQFAGGAALELTVARFTTPRGRVIDGVGLEPDIEVAASAEPGVAVQRAADVLTGLSAAAGPPLTTRGAG